jgi:hypothetical protein
VRVRTAGTCRVGSRAVLLSRGHVRDKSRPAGLVLVRLLRVVRAVGCFGFGEREVGEGAGLGLRDSHDLRREGAEQMEVRCSFIHIINKFIYSFQSHEDVHEG